MPWNLGCLPNCKPSKRDPHEILLDTSGTSPEYLWNPLESRGNPYEILGFPAESLANPSGIPILFSFVVLFWVSGFDIIYSLQDEQFDKEQNLHSIPVLLGKKNALIVSKTLHLVTILTLYYIGNTAGFEQYYWIGCSIFSNISFFYFFFRSKYKKNDSTNIQVFI